MGKPVPVRHLPDPTRTRGACTRPDPYPRVRVGSGKPAGTGIPAVLYPASHCMVLPPGEFIVMIARLFWRSMTTAVGHNDFPNIVMS